MPLAIDLGRVAAREMAFCLRGNDGSFHLEFNSCTWTVIPWREPQANVVAANEI
jgi:hypothetical protein